METILKQNVSYINNTINVKKILIISFILIQTVVFGQKFTISGYLKDAKTGEELIGASVFVIGTSTGVYTNYYGFYSITLEKGNYKVEYSYMGFSSQTVFIDLTSNKTQNIELSSSAEQIEKVVVTGEARDKNVSSTDMGVQNLQIQEIKTIPVLFGESDILKTIQLMPGVKGAGEGNSGFFVRGGGADQNLVLLDEAPVYNASHMLGFFSVFNGDAIKDVKLYKGSMPAEYGGRLSSVLDIKMKEGNSKEYHANGGIGTISSRLTLEGPIVKNKGSFLISGRRTYADMFLIFAKDTALKETKLYFYDLNMKANYEINDKNRVFLSGYFGRDVFKFQDMFGTDWGNATGTLRWVHLFSPKLFLNSTVIFSNFSNIITVKQSDMNMDLSMGITDYNIKESFQYYLNTNNTIKFGFDVNRHKFNPGKLETNIPGVNIALDKKYALESGIYVSNEQNFNDFIKLKYGLRFSSFNVIGPGTTYTYNDQHEATDTSVYSKNALIKSYPTLEPRFAATFRLNASTSIKASYTRNSQYVHLIQSSTISLPMDYWIPSTENTPPQLCNQYSVGYFKNFKENMFETSLELYYKDLKSQIDYENGTNVFLNPAIESYLLFGRGRSYGTELLFKKNSGKLTGWIGYTWSKTEKKFEGLNDGNWFPARYDRTHDVSVVAMYTFNKKWQASATWVYSTGDAVTFPSGKYEIDGLPVSYYTERNGYRMPNYHRGDLGVTWTTAKTDKFESNLNFSIYNIYSRKNAYMIYFEPTDDITDDPNKLQAVKVTLFPILPSITWNFAF